MARTSTAAASRVNRRFLFLALILAGLSAILSYAAFTNSGGGETSVASGVPVVVAKQAISAGTLITSDMIEVRDVPSTAVGDQALRTVEAAVGETTRYPLAANEQLLLSKIVGGTLILRDDLSAIIPAGMRGMAIKTTQVIGAGGLVLPGDHVDIYWSPVEVQEETIGAVLIAENVEVLAVQLVLEDIAPTAPGLTEDGAEGSASTDDGERVVSSRAEPDPEAITLTLLLTPVQAAQVFCADGGDGSIRLAVRAFGDDSAVGGGVTVGACVFLPEETF